MTGASRRRQDRGPRLTGVACLGGPGTGPRAPRRRQRSSNANHALVLMPVLLLVSVWHLSWVQAEPMDSPAIQFVRVQLPMSKIKELGRTRGPHPFFPMKLKSFDRLLDTLRRTGERANPARINHAVYSARLVGDTLTSGMARWEVEHTGLQDVMLSLGNMRFAIGSPQWSGSPPEPAELGLDEQGRTVLLVSASGELTFPWTLRGEQGRHGVEFPLELPTAASAEMLLELPAKMTPRLETGVVTPMPRAQPAQSVQAQTSRQWRLEFGAARVNRLTIETQTDDHEEDSPRFTQDTFYRMGPGGLELQTELRFDKLPAHLLLAVSPDLRLDAKLGESPLIVERVAPHQLLIELPTDREETIVRLSGFAELPLDVLWTPPQVAVEEGATWREGKTRFLISKSLRMRHLQFDGAQQTNRRQQSDGAEELRLRLDRATPNYRIHVGRRTEVLRAVTGVTLRWNEDQVSATTLVNIASDWGESFSIPVSVPPGWQVNSVETTPPNALDVAQLRPTPVKGVLTIPLLKPVSVSSPLTVKIQSHRVLLGPRKSLAGPLLSIGRPIGIKTEGYLSIQGELANDHDLVRVDSEREDVSKLVQPLPGGIIVRHDLGVEQLLVTSPPKRTEFTVDIRVEVAPSANVLEERFRVRCVPEAGAIDQMRLQLSQPSELLEWTIEDGPVVTTRAATDDISEFNPPPTPDGAKGRRWDLLFARPLSEPFVLSAVRERPLTGEPVVICLVSAPEAVSQVGAVTVLNSAPVRVQAQDLKQLPIPPPPAGELPVVQSAYRYEPAGPEPITLLPPQAGDAQDSNSDRSVSRIHAWTHHLVTRQDASGQALHNATFRLENFGEQTLRVQIDGKVEVLRATLDGTPVPILIEPSNSSREGAGGSIAVRLPVRQRHLTLKVTYRSDASSLGWKGTIQARLLRLSAPVLESRWSVYAPPGYGVYEPAVSPWRRLTGLITTEPKEMVRNRDIVERAMRLLYDAPNIATWGQLLSATQGRADQGRLPTLLVHGSRLNELGISPDSALPPSRDLLERTGLALHSYGDTVVLSDATMNRSHDRLNEYQTVSDWLNTSVTMTWPAESGIYRAVDQNWTRLDRVISAPSSEAGVATIVVRHFPTLYAAAAALMLVVAGITYRWSARHVAQAILIGWTTACLAPGLWSLWGAAMGWGSVLGGLIGVGWSGAIRVRPAIALPAAIMSIAGCMFLTADEPPKPNARLYRVLIPIDADGEMDGDRVYLPMPMWEALKTAEQEALAAPQGWLVTEADYDLSLPNSSGAPMPLAERANATMTATYRIHVFQERQRLQLPLVRRDGEVLKTTVDGEVVRSDWSEEGQNLVINVDVPGVHEVVVVRRLLTQPNLDGVGISMSLPEIPTSRMSIEMTDEVHAIQAPDAMGDIRVLTDRIQADLGPTARLTATWNAKRQPSSGQQVEEHLWLQVKRVDSVVLDSLFRFQSNDDLQQVTLLADSRLRLLNMDVDGADVTPQISATDAGRFLTVKIPAGKSMAELKASFHVTGVSGVGNIDPPRLTAVTEAAARRWFAVSVLPAELEGKLIGKAEPIDSEQFTVSWPQAKGPLQAVRVGDGELEIVVQYRETQAKADQVVRLSFSQQQLAVELDASVSDLGALAFQHQMKVPRNFQIDSITVVENDKEVSHRYDLDEAGNLSVFLDQPASAAQLIQVRGVLPVSAKQNPLPRLEMASAEIQSRRIEIFRHNDIRQVELKQVRNATVDTSRAGEHSPWGRLVAEFIPEKPKYSAKLQWQINRAVGEGHLLTILHRENNQWTAEVRGSVRIQDGSFDQLRLRVPKTLVGLLTPPLDSQVATISTQDFDEWRIVPTKPISGDYHFRFFAALDSGSDGILRAPDIALQGLPSRRYLALPRRLDQQQIDWVAPRGLQAVEADGLESLQERWRVQDDLADEAEVALSILSDGSHDVYEVVDRRFEATVQRVERTAGSALVQLADVYVAWHDQRCQGLAVFDMETGGVGQCLLALPDTCELLRVTVNDVATPVSKQSPGKYLLPLGPTYLPQRIAVAYEGTLELGERSRSIPAPTLSGVETVRTLWTVSSYDWFPSIGSSLETSDTRNELRRLETLSNLLVAGADAAADRPLEEVTNWYGPWMRRWLNSYRKLNGMSLPPDDRARVASFLSMQNNVAARLRMEGLFRQLREDPRITPTQSDVRRTAQLDLPHRLSCATQGGSSRLVVTVDAPASPLAVTLTWLMAMGVGLLATAVLPIDQWHAQWPSLFIAGVGVILAIALPWPWLGWCVIGVAMFARRR